MMKIKPWPIKIVFSFLGFLMVLVSIPLTVVLVEQAKSPLTKSSAATTWAFEETFDVGVPTSPSQSLLPKTFDYTATHRSHPAYTDGQNSDGTYSTWPADHGADCSGPPNQHDSTSSHRSDMTFPDKSFFICNNHMMSSMGEEEQGYSVTTFWPKQEFDFIAGGVLEFDLNLNPNPGRAWVEVMIAPRSQSKLGAARPGLPVSEHYPKEHILFRWNEPSTREISVGRGVEGESGVYASTKETGGWSSRYPTDPANTDRKIRRKMRITLSNNKIDWEIQKQDLVSFDKYSLDVPDGLPLNKGLVFFKTHNYTANKAGNLNLFTWHWDNIRFSGPKLAPYENYEYSNNVINLSSNGNTPIGTNETVTINLPKVGSNPVIMAQVIQAKIGQVLVSVNGRANIELPTVQNLNCSEEHWMTVRKQLDPSWLRVGANTFKFTVGPRPSCSGGFPWDGYTVKGFEVQFDGSTTPPVGKLGDLNNDNLVNILDLSILLSKFNTSDTAADLNKDGKVDLLDLSALLSKWGS